MYPAGISSIFRLYLINLDYLAIDTCSSVRNVRNVRIQRRWLWYFADTPEPSISTSLPRNILIRYVLQEIVLENRVFG